MTLLSSVSGLQPVAIQWLNEGIAISQPGAGDTPEVIVIPAEHFRLFAEAVKEAAAEVKKRGYR